MSRRHERAGWVSPAQRPRGPNDLPLCRWCNGECPTRRHTFCGPACVHEHKLRTDPGYAREQVLERDHGICRECGVDTLALYDLLRSTWLTTRPHPHKRSPAGAGDSAIDLLLREHRLTRHDFFNRKSLWDCDHHHPWAEGGHDLGLDNLVTLCIRCHRGKTAMQAQRRVHPLQIGLFDE